MKNVEIVDLKLHNNKSVSLLIQLVLIVLLIIFCVLTIFIEEFITMIYIILSLTLFVMAYNNVKFYKRKYMTLVYIIFGSYVLISALLEFI